MGYNIQIIGADFSIDTADTRNALEAIEALMQDPDAERRGYSKHSGDHFSWLNNATPEEWNTLDEAMVDWRFPIHRNDTGDVIGIEFSGQKIGQEKLMFERIAPFVETGSHITFKGEDGDTWRLEFQNAGIEEVDP